MLDVSVKWLILIDYVEQILSQNAPLSTTDLKILKRTPNTANLEIKLRKIAIPNN